MKTRVITAVVGLAFLALVLTFFDTLLFDLTLTAVCLLAIHEVFSAMGFGKKQWYLYAVTVPPFDSRSYLMPFESISL